LNFEDKLKLVDWDELEETTKIAIQALDNVIDINYFPPPKQKRIRLISGLWDLGVMGLGEMLIEMNIPYDSEDAIRLSDLLWENICINMP
jgi:ribonucleoside-diphosphate reductase alpha chain